MQLATIDMDRSEARKAYLEYRDEIRQRHDTELEQIMAGYRALARGHQVIDLVATLRAGGTKPMDRRRGGTVEVPALAVMRADQPWCHYRANYDRVATTTGPSFYFHHTDRWPRGNATRNVVRVPAGTLPVSENVSARAMVPIVPPGLRPAGDLGRFHILWEADWEAVPVDPALLRHIGGDLYAVIATWDLTDLERTVLAGRLHRPLP